MSEEKKEEKEASKKEGTAKKVDTNEAKSSPVEEQTADSTDKGSETKKEEKVQPDSRKVLDEEGNRVNNSEKEQAPSDLKGAENETKSTAEKTTLSNEQESVSKQ